MTTPRIYVASLSDYNAGRLLGRWIDATQGADGINEEIQAMLSESKESPAEEWAIHDYEGFAGLKIPEFEDIETIASVAAFVEEHGTLGALWLSHEGYGEVNDEIVEKFGEQYRGAYRSLEDFAEEFLEETGSLQEIPENLRAYFDFEKYARDLELGGDVYTIEMGGDVHVFWNN